MLTRVTSNRSSCSLFRFLFLVPRQAVDLLCPGGSGRGQLEQTLANNNDLVSHFQNLGDGSGLKGEPHFTLSQVALNDTIMVFAFAPIVGLLLGLSAITVP